MQSTRTPLCELNKNILLYQAKLDILKWMQKSLMEIFLSPLGDTLELAKGIYNIEMEIAHYEEHITLEAFVDEQNEKMLSKLERDLAAVDLSNDELVALMKANLEILKSILPLDHLGYSLAKISADFERKTQSYSKNPAEFALK